MARSEDRGFPITDYGERVYFHRSAIGGGPSFDELEGGEHPKRARMRPPRSSDEGGRARRPVAAPGSA